MGKKVILVTCYNRRAKTELFLKELYKEIGGNEGYKVYVLDDGSIDGTYEMIQRDFPDAQVYRGKGNMYWNRGMRFIWQQAVKSETMIDYFLLVNDDVRLYQGCLDSIEKSHMTFRDNIIVGCFESPSNPGKISYGGKDEKGDWVGFSSRCVFMNANFTLIPYVVYHEIGLLDERYHHGFGDYDYGLRATKAGFTLRASSEILGSCEENSEDKSLGFLARLRSLHEIRNKKNPKFLYVYLSTHFGRTRAFRAVLGVYLKAIVNW